MSLISFDQLLQATSFIKSRTGIQPEVGIILGTGLHGMVGEVNISDTIEYGEIPHFPVSTVEFHAGKLIFGHIGTTAVVMMQGRFHYYEGYSMQQITMPVRVMKLLGVRQLYVSNASGGLSPAHKKGDLMMITDHINLLPENPLRGKNINELGERFPDMSEPYDKNLMGKARQVATREGIHLHEGVYVAVQGPNLETPAEYRFLRVIGADAVGMSTVPEVIVARQMDLPVFAVSIITDLCYPGAIEKIDIASIIEAAHKAEPQLRALVRGMVENV